MRALFASLLCLTLMACSFDLWSSTPPVYVVFFEGKSPDLTPDAKDIIGKAAVKARLKPGAMVQIAGPSTKVAPGYDPSLAQPRIDAVVAQLLADGVDKDKLVQTSLTDKPIAGDLTGAERVEIRVLDAPNS